MARTAIDFGREEGHRDANGEILRLAGSAALAEGQYEEAERLLLEARAADAKIPKTGYTPGILSVLGWTECALGKRSEAQAHLFSALKMALATKARRRLLTILPLISVVLADALASSQRCVGNSPYF